MLREESVVLMVNREVGVKLEVEIRLELAKGAEDGEEGGKDEEKLG